MDLLLVGSNSLGSGDEELGQILIEKFFMTLAEAEQLPGCILFYNSGVKLSTPDSQVATYLITLAKRGVTLSACSTCTEYFGVERLKEVGAGTMKDFVEHLCSHEEVITL